eukprot:365222-Chlamydomonas_euryale.AAC.17
MPVPVPPGPPKTKPSPKTHLRRRNLHSKSPKFPLPKNQREWRPPVSTQSAFIRSSVPDIPTSHTTTLLQGTPTCEYAICIWFMRSRSVAMASPPTRGCAERDGDPGSADAIATTALLGDGGRTDCTPPPYAAEAAASSFADAAAVGAAFSPLPLLRDVLDESAGGSMSIGSSASAPPPPLTLPPPPPEAAADAEAAAAAAAADAATWLCDCACSLTL